MGAYASAAFDEGDAGLAGQWPRFWARLFDIAIYAAPAWFLVGLVFPSLFAVDTEGDMANAYLVGLLVLPLVMVIDAVVISYFGSSPGKAIAGIFVGDADGNRLTIENSLKRNALVYLKGLVLGIPLLVLIGYIYGYNAVKNDGLTSWDKDTDSRVFAGANTPARTVVIGILAVLGLVVSNALAKMP